MLFNSYAFLLVFLPAVLAGVFLLRGFDRRWIELLLIFASLLFYAWWDYRYLPLLLGSVTINYLGALFIERIALAARARPHHRLQSRPARLLQISRLLLAHRR